MSSFLNRFKRRNPAGTTSIKSAVIKPAVEMRFKRRNHTATAPSLASPASTSIQPSDYEYYNYEGRRHRGPRPWKPLAPPPGGWPRSPLAAPTAPAPTASSGSIRLPPLSSTTQHHPNAGIADLRGRRLAWQPTLPDTPTSASASASTSRRLPALSGTTQHRPNAGMTALRGRRLAWQPPPPLNTQVSNSLPGSTSGSPPTRKLSLRPLRPLKPLKPLRPYDHLSSNNNNRNDEFLYVSPLSTDNDTFNRVTEVTTVNNASGGRRKKTTRRKSRKAKKSRKARKAIKSYRKRTHRQRRN